MEPIHNQNHSKNIPTLIFKCSNANNVVQLFNYLDANRSDALDQVISKAYTSNLIGRFFDGDSSFTAEQEAYIVTVCSRSLLNNYYENNFYDIVLKRIQARRSGPINENNLRRAFEASESNTFLREACYSFIRNETGIAIKEVGEIIRIEFAGYANLKRFELLFSMIGDLLLTQVWEADSLPNDKKILSIIAPHIRMLSVSVRWDWLTVTPNLTNIILNYPVVPKDLPYIKELLDRNVHVEIKEILCIEEKKELIELLIEGKPLELPFNDISFEYLNPKFIDSHLESCLRLYFKYRPHLSADGLIDFNNKARTQQIRLLVDPKSPKNEFTIFYEEELKEEFYLERKAILALLFGNDELLTRLLEKVYTHSLRFEFGRSSFESKYGPKAKVSVGIVDHPSEHFVRLTAAIDNPPTNTYIFERLKCLVTSICLEHTGCLSRDYLSGLLSLYPELKKISFINSPLTMENVVFLCRRGITIETDIVHPPEVIDELIKRALNNEKIIFNTVDFLNKIQLGLIFINYNTIILYFQKVFPDLQFPQTIISRNTVYYLRSIIACSNQISKNLLNQAKHVAEAKLSDKSYKDIVEAIIKKQNVDQPNKQEFNDLVVTVLRNAPANHICDEQQLQLMRDLELAIPDDLITINNLVNIIQIADRIESPYALLACEKFVHNYCGMQLDFQQSAVMNMIAIKSVEQRYNIKRILEILGLLAMQYKYFKTKGLLTLDKYDQLQIFKLLGEKLVSLDFRYKDNNLSDFKLLLFGSSPKLLTMRLYDCDLSLFDYDPLTLPWLRERTSKNILNLVLVNCRLLSNNQFLKNLEPPHIEFDNTPVPQDCFKIPNIEKVTVRNCTCENLIWSHEMKEEDHELELDSVILSKQAQQDVCSLLLTQTVTVTNTKIDVAAMLANREILGDFVDTQILHNEQIRQQILSVFPPSDKDNIMVYPVHREQVMNEVHLSLVTTAVLYNPYAILRALQTYNRIRGLKVNFYDTDGIDGSGLSNQLIANVVPGMVTNSSNDLAFEENPRDHRYMPISLNHQCHHLETLGTLMVFVANSRRRYAIGEIFPPRLFAALINLTVDEIHDITVDRVYELCDILYDAKEHQMFFDHVKAIRKLDNKSVLTEEQKQFYTHQFAVDKNKIPPIEVVKKEVEELYAPILERRILALQQLAYGINRALPIQTENQVIDNWNKLRTVPCAVLDELIQGRFTKEKFIELIQIETVGEPDPAREAELKAWLVEWINSHTLEEVKNVVQMITGSPTAAIRIKFKMYGYPNFYIHTCYNLVDVPSDVTKDVLFKELNEWSKARSLGYNRS